MVTIRIMNWSNCNMLRNISYRSSDDTLLRKIFLRNLNIINRWSSFVPNHKPVCQDDVMKLQEFINCCKSPLVLTGAGVSTESGIPDYRSEGVGLYARSDRRPMTIQNFLSNDVKRKQYWARNFVGWPYFSTLKPNKCHYVLSKWEEKERIRWLVTQNVDSLHRKAGSSKLTELHGTGFVVKCINCEYSVLRHEYQKELIRLNKEFSVKFTEVRPDGDVSITDEEALRFVVPPCPNCNSFMKPDIVFFGDNVKKKVVEYLRRQVINSDGLLILGSSLQVYSGYRFLLTAIECNKRTAIVNIGSTRGDAIADLKIDANCGDVISQLSV